MVNKRQVFENLLENGHIIDVDFEDRDVDALIEVFKNILDEFGDKYSRIYIDKFYYNWDDYPSYRFRGQRLETDEELEARIAKEKAVKKAQKISTLDKERKEYERLKKKFEK